MVIGALLGGALSGLGSLFAGGAQKSAAKQNKAAYEGLKTEGLGYLDTGYGGANNYLTQVGDLYSGLSGLGQQQGSMYANALGLNGAEGNAAALGAFQTGPGYQFALDQGLQALERRASAQGRLQSGQTGLDTIGYAQGLANQEYGSWLDRLGSPSVLTSAITGQAGALSDLANLEVSGARDRIGLATDVTNGITGANNQYAAGKAEQITGGLGGLNSMLGTLSGSSLNTKLFGGYL